MWPTSGLPRQPAEEKALRCGKSGSRTWQRARHETSGALTSNSLSCVARMTVQILIGSRWHEHRPAPGSARHKGNKMWPPPGLPRQPAEEKARRRGKCGSRTWRRAVGVAVATSPNRRTRGARENKFQGPLWPWKRVPLAETTRRGPGVKIIIFNGFGIRLGIFVSYKE